jgi:hypothetical protein
MMVTSVPPITIGSKSSLEVVPNVCDIVLSLHLLNLGIGRHTVVPAKVTVAQVCSDLSEMVELAGAEMLSKRIFVQDFTADETVKISGLEIINRGRGGLKC